jgi:hypothetical protein
MGSDTNGLAVGVIGGSICGMLLTYFRGMPRFRLELRGNKLYAIAANNYIRNALHKNIENLPIKIDAPKHYESIGDCYIATFSNSMGQQQILDECRKVDAHTIIEYKKYSMMGFDKIAHKELYWHTAEKVHVLV